MDGTLNLNIKRGDGYPHELDFVEEDEVTPLNLAGRTYAAQIRATKDATDYTAFAIDTTNAATGKIVLMLTAVQTRALPDYSVWDLQETIGSADPLTLLEGIVTASGDVTR